MGGAGSRETPGVTPGDIGTGAGVVPGRLALVCEGKLGGRGARGGRHGC